MYFSSYLLWTWHAETFYAIRLHLLLLFSNYLFFFIWIKFIVHFIKYSIKKIKNIMNNRYDFDSRLIQIAVFWIVFVFIVHCVVWFGFYSTIHWCFQDIAKVIPIVRVVFAFSVHLMKKKNQIITMNMTQSTLLLSFLLTFNIPLKWLWNHWFCTLNIIISAFTLIETCPRHNCWKY